MAAVSSQFSQIVRPHLAATSVATIAVALPAEAFFTVVGTSDLTLFALLNFFSGSSFARCLEVVPEIVAG